MRSGWEGPVYQGWLGCTTANCQRKPGCSQHAYNPASSPQHSTADSRFSLRCSPPDACAQQHAVPDHGVAHALAGAGAAQGDVVQHGHVVPHNRRLANHDACGKERSGVG